MIELIVRFRLTGEFDPDQITSDLGIPPSETWRKGDFVRSTIICRETDGWCLNSALGKTAGLEQQTKAILKMFEPSWTKLEKFCSTLNAELSCSIYTSGYRPSIHFDTAVVQRMASINGTIDVDLYIMPADGDEEDYRV